MIVEIVTKSGRVMEVHSFQKNSITIGRGYGNDLILQDPYMEDQHLKVEQDSNTGEFSAYDLQTLNGTKIQGDRTSICSGESFKLPLGKILTLGKTNIRLLDKSHSLPPAIKLSSLEPLYTLMSSFWVTLLVIGSAVAITLRDAYLTDPFSDKLLKELTVVVMFAVAAACYAGLWMMIARMQRVEGRFLLNMNLLLSMLVIEGFVQLFLAVYDFNLGWLLPTEFFSMFVSFALIALVVFVSCSQTMLMKVKMSAAIAVMVGFLPIMSDLLGVLFPPDFRKAPVYNMTLVDERFQYRVGDSEQDFLARASEAFVQPKKDAD